MSSKEHDPEIALYIQRLKTHLKVRTDEELAAALGMSKQNIANWRRRRGIPARTAARLHKELGIELGSPPQRSRRAEKGAVNAVALEAVYVFLKTRWGLADVKSEDWERLGDSYTFLAGALRDYIALELPRDMPNIELIPTLRERRLAPSIELLERWMADDFELPLESPNRR